MKYLCAHACAFLQGLGRVALLSCGLGVLWGIHFMFVLVFSLNYLGILSIPKAWLLSEDRIQLLWQWSFYVMSMCTFHLSEFFTTALCNPTVTTADSFLVNHSTTYTAAAILSWTEFGIRFGFFPTMNSSMLSLLGVLVVAVSQTIRSLAMITCAESFNHLIQRSKKENHVLITHGIYNYFRHPSYVGFFYWSVGTQLALGNYVTTGLFALASCMFFRRRIPYEEESLMHLFPEEYPAYAKRTWVGIPFVPSIAAASAASTTAAEENNKTK
jgi:protein-S-isoprenylcysteine O-methyltransferase